MGSSPICSHHPSDRSFRRSGRCHDRVFISHACDRRAVRHGYRRSFLEEEAARYLRQRQQPFQEQVTFGRYFADFFLPDLALVIETDGAAWHHSLLGPSFVMYMYGLFSPRMARYLAR